MPAAPEPRLAKSYAANVVLVILTLFPGLINTSAIALAAPVIGGDLGVAPDAAAALPLISDAALAFGCLLGAELTRRVDNRTLYFWLLGVSLATSLASALAPAFGVLLAAHVLHGLAGGVLFIVILPSLITNFGSEKLGATAGVIVPALFGAATLGPLVGGLVAAPGLWRAMFGAETALALAALGLATITLQRRDPQGADEPVDWLALVVAAVGSGCVYFGAAALVGHDWSYPPAGIPVALGVALYAALVVAEARKAHPLVPVRKLFTSLALVGTLASVLGSVTFSALTQCFVLTLLRVHDLAPRAAGLAFWPEFLTAIAAGYAFGRLVATKWVIVLGAVGLGFITLAALARARGRAGRRRVGRLAVRDRRVRRRPERVARAVRHRALVREGAGRPRDRAAQPVPADGRVRQRARRRAHHRRAGARPPRRARPGGRALRRRRRPRLPDRPLAPGRRRARRAAPRAGRRRRRRLPDRRGARRARHRRDRGAAARHPREAARAGPAKVRRRPARARDAGVGVTEPYDDDLTAFAAHGAPPLPAASEQGYVEHDGARIWYAAHGAGSPVILLHGGLGNSENWGHQVPALTGAGYRAIVIDSRGHGRSTRDARPFAYELMASDVLAVMDALHVARAALVGWSDGATIALILAMRDPARVSGVFFFGCNMDPSGAKQITEPNPVIGRIFRRHAADYARFSPTPDQFEPFAGAVGLMMETQPDYSALDLGAIRVPVAIVHSEHDEFVRREHAEYLARTVPGAELVVLPEVSHFAPLQRPALFNRAVLDFLGGVR